MHSDEVGKIETRSLLIRSAIMLGVTACVSYIGTVVNLTDAQIMSSSIFIMIIMATLLFWAFRLAIAFVGTGILFGAKVITVTQFTHDTELPIILFLVGMMVIVGVLKELGLFTWIIQLVVNCKQLSGLMFIGIIVYLSALLACAVDEVTSIVFVSTLIFQVCDTLKIRATPFIIIAVLGTNVGSAGTMLGNPVGILIGSRGNLGFVDFIYWAFPIMLLSLTASLAILLFWYRKDIALLDERLNQRRDMGLTLGPLVQVPYKRGLFILLAMIAFIASHHVLEERLGLEANTLMIVAPLVVAGILMIWRYKRARHYIEDEVEWWTLLFFMMLFAVAGSLEHSGITVRIADEFKSAFGSTPWLLTPAVIFISAFGSAFVDNVVFVAAFLPVVEHLNDFTLWWALLFGACFGGNITMIGSTANIVALGMLEKRCRLHIAFFEWLKVGLLIGIVSCLIAWGGIFLLKPYMPISAPKVDSAEETGEATISKITNNNELRDDPITTTEKAINTSSNSTVKTSNNEELNTTYTQNNNLKTDSKSATVANIESIEVPNADSTPKTINPVEEETSSSQAIESNEEQEDEQVPILESSEEFDKEINLKREEARKLLDFSPPKTKSSLPVFIRQ